MTTNEEKLMNNCVFCDASLIEGTTTYEFQGVQINSVPAMICLNRKCKEVYFGSSVAKVINRYNHDIKGPVEYGDLIAKLTT